MIMARPNRLSALFLGLTAAIATLTSGAMAQNVQTQTESHVEAETLCCAGISLRAQYASMVRQSGKILVFGPEGSANAVAERWGRFVLYAPLNRLWLLDEADTVVEHAYIEVKQTPFDNLVLHWTHWLDEDISDILPAAAQIPVFTVEIDTPHPLAAAYDALLTKPLAQATGPLPAGAYFSAGGHVFNAAGAQIAEWDSFGPEIALRLMPAEKSGTTPAIKTNAGIVLRRIPVETEAEASDAAPNPDLAPDTRWQWLAVADLAAALTPKQGDQ